MGYKQNDKSSSTVAVLLAAYNGEKWIQDQLDSIIAQKNINIHIFISVYFSNDSTLDLCKTFELENNFITLLPYGEVFGGAAKNFYRLLRDVDIVKFDYISFADQDDLWLPTKLSHAVNILKDNCVEGYSSDVIAFWSDGRKKMVKKSSPQKKFDHYFQSSGAGCSYVLTRESASSLKLFISSNWKEVNSIDSQDWFIYAFFRSRNMPWYIDNNPLMLYRQHDSNQIGSNFGLFAYLKRLKMTKNGWYRSEVRKISKVTSINNDNSFNLSTSFLIRNFYQLRRENKEVFILLLLILFGIF